MLTPIFTKGLRRSRRQPPRPAMVISPYDNFSIKPARSCDYTRRSRSPNPAMSDAPTASSMDTATYCRSRGHAPPFKPSPHYGDGALTNAPSGHRRWNGDRQGGDKREHRGIRRRLSDSIASGLSDTSQTFHRTWHAAWEDPWRRSGLDAVSRLRTQCGPHGMPGNAAQYRPRWHWDSFDDVARCSSS